MGKGSSWGGGGEILNLRRGREEEERRRKGGKSFVVIYYEGFSCLSCFWSLVWFTRGGREGGSGVRNCGSESLVGLVH